MDEQRDTARVADTPGEELAARIGHSAPVIQLLAQLGGGAKRLAPGLIAGSAKTLLIAHLWRSTGQLITVIAATPAQAKWLADDLRVVLGEEVVFEFPGAEVLPYEESSPDSDVISMRMAAIAALRDHHPCVMVTTVGAVQCRIPDADGSFRGHLRMKVGSTVGHQHSITQLVAGGYLRVPVVEEIGQFSVRGGIIDVFPPGIEDPVRIEFDGDTVASLRSFSPQTQRSLGSLHEVPLLPHDEFVRVDPSLWEHDPDPRLVEQARGFGVTDAQIDRMLLALQQDPAHPCRRWCYPLFSINPSSVLDELPEGGVLVIDDRDEVAEEAERGYAEALAEHDRRLRLSTLMPLLPPDLLFDTPRSLLEKIDARASLLLRLTGAEGELRIHHAEAFGGSISFLKERLDSLAHDGYDIWVSCENLGQHERLTELLGSRPQVRLWVGGLRHGFIWADERVALFTDQDIFERYARRRRRRRHHAGLSPARLLELNPGDFVVHAYHGVGRFEGLTKVMVMNREEEVLALTYRGGDKLYLPVEQSHLIDRYLGPDARAPAMDSLGGARWKQTKARVRRAVQDLAQELLRLYASRQAKPGLAFPPADHWEAGLAASFPFQETPDQLTAWGEIDRDMASDRSMDRLVCGDVGYGKTELAVRAAFRAVLGGKQVAVLVPTTILAEQHYNTFRERLAEYPVNAEMLSRFRSKQEQRAIVRKLREGSLDIVIGTHRLLQKDIAFKDLGLAVIDEEQRFGVEHKERLKQLRSQIDVLTMTATPIPRTLYLALAGARDMSVVNTPPQGRVPHKTVVCPFDEEVIAQAILREIGRGGQTYFVHNRVESIGAMASFLKKLLPQVRFAIAHGQMSERALEDVMHAFIGRDVDVLVCTMIIESGLDIPGVDTILINRADRFGLAQLYQLRGRVGRGARQAYAYLLIPPYRTLTPQARRRLDAMKQFSELGSGLRLSLLDLEIRGVGNILGRDQHGHVADVGFHLYCSMLEEEVRRLRGESVPSRQREFSLHAVPPLSLPDGYVEEEGQRLEIYRRLARAESPADVDDIREELRDRFGGCPDEVERLFRAVRLKILLQPNAVDTAYWISGELAIAIEADDRPSRALVSLASTCGGSWRTDRRSGTRLVIPLSPHAASGSDLDPVLAALEKGAVLDDSSDTGTHDGG